VSTSLADLNVITDRSDFHLKQLAKDYQRESGEKVNVFYTKKGLLQRASVEDYDVVITKNSSEIVAAKEKGMLKMLPESMYHSLDINNKDIDFTWFNMSHRIRAFYVKKGMENPPLSYSDLANPEYKGKICTRSHTHNYNLEMYGYLLDSYGKKDFENWFNLFKQNLARKPVGNDRNQVKGVYDGECEIAIANTYYMGLMMNNPKQKSWTEAVDLIIPNQNGERDYDDYMYSENGAISLYSGVGVLKKSKRNVEPFLKYLISKTAQKGLSRQNFEYPLDRENVGKTANQFGKFQGLEYKDIKLRFSKQNELYHLRKEVYKIIK
jgi:iron(III) transport system substrate-binding protein